MMKKYLPFFIVFLLLFTATGSVSAAPLFKDVDDNYWAKAELAYLVEQGILIGDATTEFGINKEITRLQASEMIVKARGLDTTNRPAPHFKDVKPGDDGYAIIATIADEGIMTGTAEGEFKPDAKLTRAQMAKILVIAFDLKGTTAYSFRDVSLKNWASDFIKTLLVNEVTTGYGDNTYKPGISITKAHFSIFLARILQPDFKQSLACHKLDNTKTYVVNVAVTTLWKEPNKARAVDRPAVSTPVDITKWTAGMTIPQKQWLVGNTESQALYGQEVAILKSSGNWHYIAVKDQYSPKNKTGYPGWVPKAHITEIYPNYTECQLAIVDGATATLYNTAATTSKFMDISFNTSLPIVKEEAQWLHVQTPVNGVKYVRKQDVNIVKDQAAIAKPTQQDIVNTAKMFEGLPYLWAGTSGFGFDCSGLTYSVYKSHGITIPRDSTVQAVNGVAVAKNNLQPGDLLFYSHNKGKGAVHHVSLYIGNGQMIHAPNPKKSVEIISINTEPFKSEFSGARRYLK